MQQREQFHAANISKENSRSGVQAPTLAKLRGQPLGEESSLDVNKKTTHYHHIPVITITILMLNHASPHHECPNFSLHDITVIAPSYIYTGHSSQETVGAR